MNPELFFSQISSNTLTPISKILKQNQIHNDYNHCLSSTGHMIASNSISLPYKSDFHQLLEPTVGKRVGKSSSMNCIERALAAQAFYKPEKVTHPDQEGLYFSKKPRFIEYTPYSARDYKEIKKTPELGSIGAWRVGSIEWEHERTRRIRMKNYSQNIRGLNK